MVNHVPTNLVRTFHHNVNLLKILPARLAWEVFAVAFPLLNGQASATCGQLILT